MKYFKFFIPALIIIVLDHVLKLWVHFNMTEGQDIQLFGEWGRLYFVLNPGIAYGIKMNFPFGKLILSLIRIFAVTGLAWFILRLIKRKVHTGLILTLSIILGGAIGNMIDSVFYGVFLENNAIYNASSPWFHGQVIDMLHFPMINSTFPEWFPFWGGESFVFFRPIFNIADAAISVGFAILLLRQKTFFESLELDKKKEEEAKAAAEAPTSVEVAADSTTPTAE